MRVSLDLSPTHTCKYTLLPSFSLSRFLYLGLSLFFFLSHTHTLTHFSLSHAICDSMDVHCRWRTGVILGTRSHCAWATLGWFLLPAFPGTTAPRWAEVDSIARPDSQHIITREFPKSVAQRLSWDRKTASGTLQRPRCIRSQSVTSSYSRCHCVTVFLPILTYDATNV